jgi:murein tripeptide amidase MpaA
MNWGLRVITTLIAAAASIAWLLAAFDRRAKKAIAGHIGAALANSAAWLDDGYADCLDCAGDGSHDSLVLDRCEEFAWREIEREYDRSTP